MKDNQTKSLEEVYIYTNARDQIDIWAPLTLSLPTLSSLHVAPRIACREFIYLFIFSDDDTSIHTV